MTPPALSAMDFGNGRRGTSSVASREPNLEGTSPSPIPVAASPSGQLRSLATARGRLHPVLGDVDKSG